MTHSSVVVFSRNKIWPPSQLFRKYNSDCVNTYIIAPLSLSLALELELINSDFREYNSAKFVVDAIAEQNDQWEIEKYVFGRALIWVCVSDTWLSWCMCVSVCASVCAWMLGLVVLPSMFCVLGTQFNELKALRKSLSAAVVAVVVVIIFDVAAVGI